MPSRCTRRTLLAASGIAGTCATSAGCLDLLDGFGDGTSEDTSTTTAESTATQHSPNGAPKPVDPDELTGYIRPEDDPRTIPEELVCEDGRFERRSGWIDEENLQWGNLSTDAEETGFALRVNSLSVAGGETVTFTLTNVSDEERQTGNIHKANFEVYTEVGWQDPRGWVDGQPRPITDELWDWSPGEGHELTFEMTAEGVVEGGYDSHEDSLVTCPGLPTGRYRFATAAPEQGDLAVAFDLTD